MLIIDYCLLKFDHPYRRGNWMKGLRAHNKIWGITERTVDLVAGEIGSAKDFENLSEYLGGCKWLTRDLDL